MTTEKGGRNSGSPTTQEPFGDSSGWTLRTALEHVQETKYTDEQAKGMIESDVRDEDILLLAALRGEPEVWKIVSTAVQEAGEDLLKQALRIKPTWFEGSVLLAAADSKKPGMVKQVLECVWKSLAAEEVKEMIERDVRDSHLLLKAAGTGCIGTWRTIVEAAEAAGRGLLEEALVEISGEASMLQTVLNAAVGSKDSGMVEEVLGCLKDNVSESKVKHTMEKNVREVRLAVNAAYTGNVEVWKVVVEELAGRDLLKEALTNVPTLLDGSVLMAAVDSKEPEMAKEVLKCVRSSLSDDQMKEMIAKDVQDKGLLVSAANTGSIEVWEVVVAVVKATDPVLLEKALEVKPCEAHPEVDVDESLPFDGSVFKAAMYSDEPGMVKEVLEFVQNNLTDNQAKEVLESHVRVGHMLTEAAGTGSIDVWKIAMEAVQAADQNLLQEALMMETEFGDTALTAAVQSEEPEMVRNVLVCVKDTLPEEKANEMIDNNVRKAELLLKAVRTGSVEVWDIVIGELKERGRFEQALKLKTVDNDTVLTEAIESMDLAMVKQVLECVQTNSSGPQQVKTLFMAKEHWGRAVLEEVANSGDIEIWTAVVDIFKTHGMLEEALTPTSIDGTVLTAAIESANPAMATKVLDSVQENISDPQQVKQLLVPTSEDHEPVLHQLARKGDVDMWAAVAAAFKKLGLLQEALKRTSEGETVLAAAIQSEHPAIAKEVLDCVIRSP